MLAAIHHLMLAASVNITPNTTGLPGISTLESIVGALLTVALIAALAGVVLSALIWSIAHHSHNPSVAARAKTGVIVSIVAAILIGSANELVNFFVNAGSAIH